MDDSPTTAHIHVATTMYLVVSIDEAITTELNSPLGSGS